MFVEHTIPNKPNFIAGAMYKYPSMQHCNFSIEFLQNLLNKIQTEKKFSVLAGNFNLNLIKYSKTTNLLQLHASNNTSYWSNRHNSDTYLQHTYQQLRE